MIPHDVIGLGGLAVIGIIGEKALKAAGQSDLAQYLTIIITVAGSILAVKVFWIGVGDALAVVGVHL